MWKHDIYYPFIFTIFSWKLHSMFFDPWNSFVTFFTFDVYISMLVSLTNFTVLISHLKKKLDSIKLMTSFFRTLNFVPSSRINWAVTLKKKTIVNFTSSYCRYMYVDAYDCVYLLPYKYNYLNTKTNSQTNAPYVPHKWEKLLYHVILFHYCPLHLYIILVSTIKMQIEILSSKPKIT